MALDRSDISDAFGDNRVHRRRTKRDRTIFGAVLTLSGVAAVAALVAANVDKLSMGPNPDDISLRMANVAATRILGECKVNIETPPHTLRNNGEMEGSSNFTTARLAYGQDLCVEDVLKSLANTVDGCDVDYLQSGLQTGWTTPNEEGTRVVVNTDCLSNYLPQQ